MNYLYRQVKEGLLHITLLVGPPRCLSTGTAIALAQSPDVDFYVHEPFANDYKGFPSAAAGTALVTDLLRRLKRSRQVTVDDPARIVIKECSTHLRPLHFRFLAENSDTVIVMVRSPLLQLSSVGRICKWVWSDCPSRFGFDIKHLKTRDVRRYARNGDLDVYFLNPWKTVQRQIAMLDGGIAWEAPSWLVVDTELIRAEPREYLKGIASQAGLRFTDRMLSGWRKDHLFNIANDGWTRTASHARRLHSPKRHAPPMQDFPESWQPAMHDVFSIYFEALQSEHFSGVLPPAAWRRISGHFSMEGRSRAQTPPDTAYVLALTSCVPTRKAFSIRNVIRRTYLPYEEVFDYFDAISRGSGLPNREQERGRSATSARWSS